MQTTTNYELRKYESGDLFNPLTVNNPNLDDIDTDMKAISDRAIGRATELVSQGVHAITVLDTDCKTIKWVATANFAAGETFTINGIQCNAYLPSGEALGTNAYVSGATVIASLNSDNSAMTVYVPQGSVAVASDSERLGGELPIYYATKDYADGIKSTADNASDLITKKSLVNTYYDTSTGKMYVVNANGSVGGEISMGSRMLDYAHTIDLTPATRAPLDYTPTQDGDMLIGARIISGDTRLYIDNKPVLHIPSNNDLDPIKVEGISAGSHVYTLGSIYEDTTGTRMITYVPYL